MSDLLKLAERCEKATGPDRDLDATIERVLRNYSTPLPLYTASIDAAMTLAVQGISAADVLRHAITRCSRYGCPTFIEALPRFVAAEWLRARSEAAAVGGR